MYILGASLGPLVTGMLSDQFARAAMQTAGAAAMTDAYKAIMGKVKEYGELYPKYEKLSNSTDVDGYQAPN